MVVDAIRTILAQPSHPAASEQLQALAVAMNKPYPKTTELLRRAEDDILTYMAFPEEHWRRFHSTNPLERLNQEVKRRTNMVGIFPDRASVIRLVGALLNENDDEWQVGRRYFSQASMKCLLEPEKLAPSTGIVILLAPIH